MNSAKASFPLEPLCTVRGIRLRALEAEMKRCRQLYAEAEARRLEAARQLLQAEHERQEFGMRAWQGLFEQNTPTAMATDRYKKHLALLDQQIGQLRLTLEACQNDSAEALLAVEAAGALWRQGRHKLDAVGEMKQEWLREARHRAELHEEHGMEELLVRRTTVI